MGIDRWDANAVLGSLYAAVSSSEGWSPFLARVCAVTKSHAGALAVFESGGGGVLPGFVGAGETVARAYESRYAMDNPWRTTTGRPGALQISDDLVPWETLRGTPFWQDFLRPIDVAHGVGLVGARSNDRILSLTVLRSHKEGAYRGNDVWLLEQLVPHWLNASTIWTRLDTMGRRTADLRTTLDHLTKGAWLVDAVGTVLQANATAERLLSDGLVHLRRGQLTARRPSEGAALAAAFARSAAAPNAPQAALVLRDDAGRAMATVKVHRITGPGATSRTRLLVFVQQIGAPAAEMQTVLCNALGLTAGEARLAEALARFRGNLGAAAEALGIAPGAARTKMKTVLHKAGVSSQAELLQLMHALASSSGFAREDA